MMDSWNRTVRDLFDEATADLPLSGPSKKGKRPRQITQENFGHVLEYFIRMHGRPKRLTELQNDVLLSGREHLSPHFIDRLQVFVDSVITAQEWTRCLNLLARNKADLKGKPARIPVNRDTLAQLEALKNASGGQPWDELMLAMADAYREKYRL